MNISFSCPACGKTFTTDERMAGKRAKCKACGCVLRIPDAAEAAGPASDSEVDDPYGLHDIPGISTKKWTLPPDDDDDQPPPPRRGSSGTKSRPSVMSSSLGGVNPREIVAYIIMGGAVLFLGVLTHATLTSTMPAVARLAAGPRSQPAGFPGMPTPTPAPTAPFPVPGPAGPQREVRSDLKVVLSDGRFMRNTTPIGTAQPGMEISVDYNIESGGLAPGEHASLIIKSSKGRGRLDNLNELRMRPSGTIHASSIMASSEEGPYEAWMEVSTMGGPFGSSRRVSNSISLQFTDVPVRDPGAEMRAAMEKQRQQMMQGMPGAPGAPAPMPRPGPIGPRFPGFPR